jgi:hypothetical protein
LALSKWAFNKMTKNAWKEHINKYFLKRTWFFYVLWKYQVMFKVLQWNARQWKTPTLKIARSSPVYSVFLSLKIIQYIHKYHFTCLSVCYSQMHGRTVILKLWLHNNNNNNEWLNNTNSSIRLMQTRHYMFAT